MASTDDSYTGSRPCRFEQYLSKVSIRSCDLSSQGGGSLGPPAITQGEVSAKLAGLQVPDLRGLVADYEASRGAEGLIRYKYLGDQSGRSPVVATGMMIATSLAMQNDWNLEPRRCLRNCVNVAINDICAPAPYIKSIREWSTLIGLDNHMQWQRTWSARYRDIRYYIKSLELAAIEHIRRR